MPSPEYFPHRIVRNMKDGGTQDLIQNWAFFNKEIFDDNGSDDNDN